MAQKITGSRKSRKITEGQEVTKGHNITKSQKIIKGHTISKVHKVTKLYRVMRVHKVQKVLKVTFPNNPVIMMASQKVTMSQFFTSVSKSGFGSPLNKLPNLFL